MDRIAIIGKFCSGYEAADGQSVKTRIIARELEQILGEDSIRQIDTYGWKKHPLRLMSRSVRAVWQNRNVIFMTDEGGINIYPWLLSLANLAGRSRVHYVVVGGWLSRTIGQHRLRRFWLKKLRGIYVETNTMKTAMEAHGFTNVVLLPNCKRLTLCREEELPRSVQEPLRLCTFSRVMREKGIEDAVNAVNEINRRHGRQVFTLDIYGQVDAGELDWFEELRVTFPEGVRYGGIIPYQQSTEVLRDYFALLFPTRFYTEGIPGTIIDAYASGLPVISAEWESFRDILDEEVSLSYPFGSYEGLVACLERAAADPAVINAKRSACLQRAQLYSTERVMQVLLEHLRD